MLDFLRRDGDSSNTVIGIILLVMLLVFVGPNVLPSLLSRTFPFIDEGVPCAFLRSADNRADHQSLIGRSAVDPLTLRTQVDPLPQTNSGTWTIRITVQNNTIGTVPFVFNEDQVIVGDNGTSGLGLSFSSNISLGLGVRTADPASFNEANIRLLGPRQRCVHRAEFPATIANVNTIPGNTQVASFYRINTAGGITGDTINAVFTDQGLNILNNTAGFVQSDAVVIPFSATAG